MLRFLDVLRKIFRLIVARQRASCRGGRSETFKLPFWRSWMIDSLVQTRTRSGRFSVKRQTTEEPRTRRPRIDRRPAQSTASSPPHLVRLAS
jgi:hypothetical protein